MLQESQIRDLVQRRPNKSYIEAGKKHQYRLQLHSDMVLHKNNLSPAYNDLLNWLGSKQPELLPLDKFERFKQLCTTPLPTISLTDNIFTYLYRIFEAQDRFCRYEFKNPDFEDDWKEFCDDEFWEVQGFAAMKNAIDSVWIVELPEEQIGDSPEPRDRLIDISQVIDIDNDRDNACQHLIFSVEDRLFVYDDTLIRVFDYKDGKVGKAIIETAHGLGYCPARMFWSDKLSPKNPINKKAPLTAALGDLDWLLTLKVFKKYMDMSNAYPIIAAYESNDDFTEMPREGDDGRTSEEKKAANSFIGPGTLWTVKPPVQGEPDLMNNPVKLISPDVDTLRYHTESESERETEIFRKVTGNGGEAFNETAKNEKQITSGFESQMIVLRNIASNFEAIQKFADKVKCELRYGPENVLDIAIDYGSRFFLRSVEELTESISDSKEKGIDDGMIDTMTDELLETRFRNDKRGMMRAKIIRELDPLPDKTTQEAIDIFNAGGIDKISLVLKINKISFVKRFEREQLPLQFFGESMEYGTKIAKIHEEFLKYAAEMEGEKELKGTEKQPVSGDVPAIEVSEIDNETV